MAEDIVSRLVLQGQQYFSTINQAHQRTQKFQKDSQQGFRSVTGAIQLATKALVAFGAAAVVRQIFQAINNTARWGDELAKLSQRTGLTVESLNGLTQAAAVADVSQEQLSVGLRMLSKNLLDTTRGTGEAKESFKAMGIGGKEAAALLKTPDKAFLDIADRLAAIPDTSVRAAEAMRIFGRSGAEMLPFLNQGAEAIKRQMAEFQKLRPITTEQAKAAEAYNDSITALTFAFEGFLHKGIGPLLPSLTQFIKLMTELVALDFENLGFRMNTVFQDLGMSLKLVLELMANPFDFSKTMQKYEALDKRLQEERRKRFAGPEAPGPGDIDTLPGVTVTAKSQSSVLEDRIKLLEARNKLIQAEEDGLGIASDRVRIHQEEIALLQEALAVQKEIEAANVEGKQRDINESVAITARIEKEAKLKAIQNERLAIEQEEAALREEEAGYDITSAATQQQNMKLRGAELRLAEERLQLELETMDPLRDASLLRGRQITLLNAELVVLREREEVLGESHKAEMRRIEARKAALIEEGRGLTQESLGRGIVAGATADIQRQLEPLRRAVRDIQKEIDIGAAMPNTLPETQELRQQELIQATIDLRREEWRVGNIGAEEYYAQVGVLEAQQFALTDKSQRGFLEGWQHAFSQFANDADGAFGMAQVLARNFIGNLQSGTASTLGNIFDHAAEKTLTWRTALETIPNILKQITTQMISMVLVQGIAQAVGGGLSGAFGGGASGGIGAANARGAANPALFGPGFATGGAFIVGGPMGTDKTGVRIKASRGEEINVLTPAQQQERRGGFTVNVFNSSGAEVSTREGADGRSMDIMVRRIVRSEVGSGPSKKIISQQTGSPIRGRVG